jgi:hypothetical protein
MHLCAPVIHTAYIHLKHPICTRVYAHRRYVSLSGHRFRHIAGDPARVVVVGAPGEIVTVTYLVPSAASASGWVARLVDVKVGGTGRTLFTMV